MNPTGLELLQTDVMIMNNVLHTDGETLARFVRDGVMPTPVVIGGVIVRWATATILEWVAAGLPPCDPPSSETMEQIQDIWWSDRAREEEVARYTFAEPSPTSARR